MSRWTTPLGGSSRRSSGRNWRTTGRAWGGKPGRREAGGREAGQIRKGKAARDDLNDAVRALKALLKARSQIARRDEKLDPARRTLRVKELAREINDGERHLIALAA